MVAYTDEYGLSLLGQGDDWTRDGYKYANGDRRAMARLLKVGAETHHHTGEDAAVLPTDRELDFLVITTLGDLPAGRRIYYRYTLVDVLGFETAASPEFYVDTDDPIEAPNAPILQVETTGGSLPPGNYYYVLTAYTNANTQETKALAPNYVSVPIGSSANQITIVFPSLPAGADGFNVYVKRPGATGYAYLASVDMTPIVDTEYLDDGSVAENPNRTTPASNSTNANNTVVATLTGDDLDEGITWKLYRTITLGNYDNSLLHHVVEETFEGSGIITLDYEDTGIATGIGSPPTASQTVGSPPKIDFTDAAEIQGTAPPANIVFREVVEFRKAGTLAAASDLGTWRCPFEEAQIIEVILSLGKGYAPAATEVIVDVNKYDSAIATPAWATIFTNQSNRPRVPVGTFIGQAKVPAVQSLVRGDFLSFDIDQAGGGATPNDKDLLVQIVLYYSDSADESVVFE